MVAKAGKDLQGRHREEVKNRRRGEESIIGEKQASSISVNCKCKVDQLGFSIGSASIDSALRF